MCFSATGSFALAGVLTGVGVASLAQHQSRVFRLLAAAPLLFAAQQAAEGIVWLTLDEKAGALHATAVNAFLGLALVVWPAYLPLSLLLAERRPRRRRALVALGVVGAIVSATAWFLLARWQPAAQAVGHSIHYEFASIDLPGREFILVVGYVLPTVVPFFVSSATLTRTIGLTLVVALLVTAVVERETLTSVWCFFAAILSALLLVTVRRESRSFRTDLSSREKPQEIS
jgi:hypothetical protein